MRNLSVREALVIQNRIVRYAVVGLGHIAQTAILPAFKKAKNSKLVGVFSSDSEKRDSILSAYKLDFALDYTEFAQVMSSQLIDAVYICVPNHLHFKFAKIALSRGIHVLCETPLALTVDEARQLENLALEWGVKLMTGYRLHFNEANLEACKIAKSGQIGEVRFFTSIFSMNIREGNIRTEFTEGGGPLYDIGIYCLNTARCVMGELPQEVFAFANDGFDERFEKVNEMISVNMRYKDGRMAQFVASFSGESYCNFDIVGTAGRVRLDNSYEYDQDMKLTWLQTKDIERTQNYPRSDQFAPEIIYFSNCILQRKEPEPNAIEGLLDLMAIESIQESIRSGKVVRMPAVRKDGGPCLDQAMNIPPNDHSFPNVNVAPPSQD